MDWRSSEFQEILDIKPSRVEEKKQPSEGDGKSENKPEDEKDKYGGFDKDDNIFTYFHLPSPRECAPDILDDVSYVAEKLKGISQDGLEFFMFLKSIDQRFPSDDPITRIKNVKMFIKASGSALKRWIDEYRILSKDLLAEDAKETGDWRRYLKYSAEKSKELRK